jgi:hypothetical protein
VLLPARRLHNLGEARAFCSSQNGEDHGALAVGARRGGLFSGGLFVIL